MVNEENLTIKFTDNKDNEITKPIVISGVEIKKIKFSKLLMFDKCVNVKVIFNEPIEKNVVIVTKKARIQ